MSDFEYIQHGKQRVAIGYSAIYFKNGERFAFLAPSIDELKKVWDKYTPKGTADLDLTAVQKISIMEEKQ